MVFVVDPNSYYRFNVYNLVKDLLQPITIGVRTVEENSTVKHHGIDFILIDVYILNANLSKSFEKRVLDINRIAVLVF